MTKKVTISEYRFNLMVSAIMAAVQKNESGFNDKVNDLILIPVEHAVIERSED